MRIIDLSVPVNASTMGPPAAGSPPVVFQAALRGPGHWQSSRMETLLHTGSHVDSPLHVLAGREPIQGIALDQVIGDAVVIDVHEVEPRTPIDLRMLEAAAPSIDAGQIVAIRTDWSDRSWGTFPEYYTRSPFLTQDAAEWLAALAPKAVVFDFFEEECAASSEFDSEDFVVHRALLGRGIPLVEQAIRLGALGSDRFVLHAPFTRLEGVEAAPCRIYAVAE